MVDPVTLLMDNPILTKHVRSRLRPAQVGPWAIVIVVLCFCILFFGFATNSLHTSRPIGALLFLQVIIIVFAGAQQVGVSVGAARQSGIIDFHRVAPISPARNVAGFLLGAPIREYVLAALTFPFGLFLALAAQQGPIWILAFLAAEAAILLVAAVLHCVALLSALATKKPKAGGGGQFGILVFGLIFGPIMVPMIVLGLGEVDLIGGTVSFFGLGLHWLLVLAIYAVPLIVTFLVPSVRKMRSDRLHGLTKPQAVGVMALFTLLILGGAWGLEGVDFVVVVVLYLLVGLGIVLASVVTPNQVEYVRALRRSLHAGRLRPSPWSDEGVNRLAVGLIGVIALVGATVAWEGIEGRTAAPANYSLTIAVGVLTIGYYGLGLQAAMLHNPKRGTSYFSLFLFFAWLLPILIGTVLSASGMDQGTEGIVLGLSPLVGIALSTGEIDAGPVRGLRGAAIAPAVTFVVMFYYFLEVVQRRIDRQVRSTMPREELDPWSKPDEPEPVGPVKQTTG